MPTSSLKTARNQTLECFKLIASVFVVFIHIKFPDRFGELMTCLARFAVPLFFTISGYFSYQTKSSRLVKRITHLLLLQLLGLVLFFGWNSFFLLWTGGDLPAFLRDSLPYTFRLSRWIVMSVDPYWGHLWFLAALALSYGILWGYLRFFEDKSVTYQPLYLVSTVLMILQLTFGEFFTAAGMELPIYAYRNAFFCGLPFLTLGIFLREYQDRIFRVFSLTSGKLVLAIIATMAFSAMEWHGIGTCEMYLGTVLAVPAMILFAASHPTVSRHPVAERIISKLGSVSTGVYLLHMAVLDFYSAFIRWRMELFLFDKEPWFTPIFVALISIIASACCIWAWDLVKRIFKKK